MFCGNCGKEISDDSVFCENCGEKTGFEDLISSHSAESATDRDSVPVSVPAVKSVFSAGENKFKKTALFVVVAVAVFLCVFTIAKNSGRNYIYITLAKSQKAYKQELNDFINKNAVLKTLKSNISQSNTNRIRLPLFTFTLNDDKKAKALSLLVRGDFIPTCGVYLSDTRLIAGARDIFFIEAEPSGFGADVRALAEEFEWLDKFDFFSDITDALEACDLTYTGVTSKKAVIGSEDYIAIKSRYTGVFKQLISKSDYKKESSSVRIGEKDVKAEMLTLSANHKIMSDWLKNDLIPALRTDKELKKYWNSFAGLYGAVRQRGLIDFDYYDYFIEDFTDEVDYIIDDMTDANMKLTVRAKVYKGVIVSVELETRSDDFENPPSFTISALGNKYRLNDILFNAKDENEDEYSVSIAGDHIGADIFNSAITINDGDTREKVTIEWDMGEQSGNLKIKLNGETAKATLASDGQTVTAKYGDISWKNEPFDGIVELPEKTTSILDITEEGLSGFIPLLYNFFR